MEKPKPAQGLTRELCLGTSALTDLTITSTCAFCQNLTEELAYKLSLDA